MKTLPRYRVNNTSTINVSIMTNSETAVCRETVEFAFKGPVPIYLDDERQIPSGCAAVDIVLAKPSRVGEIVFRNYYVASVNVLVQCVDKEDSVGLPVVTNGGGSRFKSVSQWTVSIPRKELMRNVHEEEGSHNFVSIPVTESQVPWENVVAFRILLRQPSPVWSTFRLDEFNLFGDLPRLSSSGQLPNSVVEAMKLVEIAQRQTIRVLNGSNDFANKTDGTRSNAESGAVHEFPLSSSLPVAYEIQKLPA